MLRISKLNFAYGDMQVLWDVDLEVKQGEIVTVVGSNGAGKSTILKNVSRLVRPGRGEPLHGARRGSLPPPPASRRYCTSKLRQRRSPRSSLRQPSIPSDSRNLIFD